MIRIIGGSLRSRLIKTPKTCTRPTSSMVRKAFFDICQSEVEGSRFLDLYAGSGAMGIEALSRGASHSTFVDHNRQVIHVLKENLKALELEEKATIMMKEALPALKALKNGGSLFDLIYIDPPYDQDPFPILQFLDENPLLSPEGHLFFEEGSPSKIPIHRLHHLKWIEGRKFGTTILNQFRH